MNCYIVFLVMIIQKFSMYLKCGLAWMNFIISFYPCLSSSKKNLKNSGLNRDSNPDLCNAIAVLYQLSYHCHLSPHLAAYNWPTQRPAPSRPDSWTVRGLHQCHRVQGSNPHSGLNFSGLSHCYVSSGKMQWSNSFSCVFFFISFVITFMRMQPYWDLSMNHLVPSTTVSKQII